MDDAQKDLVDLLARFKSHAEAADGPGFGSLFTDDAVYVDGFHGPYHGPDAIGQMLVDDFYGAMTDCRWDLYEPVVNSGLGYFRYLFSYTSTLSDAAGKRVVFDGMARVTLKGSGADMKIRHYSEIFDRGLALAQLDFAPERIAKVVGRAADLLRASPDAHPHINRKS
ncbi:MAG: nuclear transport factor 2 family protein [Alphaproteobacteria bacterium]